MDENTINIMIECDEAYIESVAVCMKSFRAFHEGIATSLYILSRNWTDSGKEELKEILRHDNIECVFVDIRDKLQQLRYYNKKDAILFGYLLIEDLIPVDKIINIDVDVVFNGCILDAWNCDMEGILVASELEICDELPIVKAAIGLEEKDLVLNSGFIVMNLVEFRNQKICEKVTNFVRNYDILDYKKSLFEATQNKKEFWKVVYNSHNCLIYHDEAALAKVINNSVILLPPAYNVVRPIMKMTYEQLNSRWNNAYSKQEYEDAIHHPIVIHYAGGDECDPRYEECVHEYKEYYDLYRNQTKYASYPKLRSATTKRIEKKRLLKKLPSSVVAIIYHLAYRLERQKQIR